MPPKPTLHNLIVNYLVKGPNPLPQEMKLNEIEKKELTDKLLIRAKKKLWWEEEKMYVDPEKKAFLIDNHLLELMSMEKLTQRELDAVYFLQEHIRVNRTKPEEFDFTDQFFQKKLHLPEIEIDGLMGTPTLGQNETLETPTLEISN